MNKLLLLRSASNNLEAVVIPENSAMYAKPGEDPAKDFLCNVGVCKKNK